VVAEALAPYRGEGETDDRFVVSGPAVRLLPRTALSIAMALHELATNAVKYGALSVEGGQVTVAWSVARRAAGRRLRLRWEEAGGPAVAAPRRRGFGSRLIERGLAAELDGEVELQFAPTGVVCRIDVPLETGPRGAQTRAAA
jgi:two-component sensor histidine kinase